MLPASGEVLARDAPSRAQRGSNLLLKQVTTSSNGAGVVPRVDRVSWPSLQTVQDVIEALSKGNFDASC